MFGQGAASTCPTGLARLEAELTSLKSEAAEVEEACAALDNKLAGLSDRIVDLMGSGPSSPLGSMLTSAQLQSLRESLRKDSSSGEAGFADSDSDADDDDGDHSNNMRSIVSVGKCVGVQRIAASIEMFLGAMAQAEHAAQEKARIMAEGDSASGEVEAPSFVGRLIGTLASPFRAKRKRDT